MVKFRPLVVGNTVEVDTGADVVVVEETVVVDLVVVDEVVLVVVDEVVDLLVVEVVLLELFAEKS